MQAAPANDNYAGASSMNAALTSVPGFGVSYSSKNIDTITATVEGSEPGPSCAYTTGNFESVWFKFLSTTTALMTADTFGSNYDTIIQLRKAGGPPDSLANSTAESACNDQLYDPGTGNYDQSKIAGINLSKGVTYYFQISAYSSGSGGNLVFSATMTPVLVDTAVPTVLIQNPADLSYPQSLTVISGTAADTGLPNPGVSVVQININIGSSINYWNGSSFVASGAGPLWLDVNYSSGAVSTNWDYVSLPAWTNNQTYIIQARARDIAGNLSAVAQSSFTFTLPSGPGNDTIANAGLIGSTLPYVTTSQNISATYALDKNASCTSGNSDVWWKYSSTGSAGVEINTFGSNFDTVLAVWKATSPVAPGVEIACNDQFQDPTTGNWNQSKVTFQLESATTYYIQVYSYSGSNTGSINLTVKELDMDGTVPGNISDLTASKNTYPGSVILQWTAPGDDGTNGTVTAYDIRYSTVGIMDADAFPTGRLITSSPTFSYINTPRVAGSTETLYVYGLPERATVYFNIQARDDGFLVNNIYGPGASVIVPGSAPQATNSTPTAASFINFLPYSDEVNTTGSTFTPEIQPLCSSYRNPGADVWYKYISSQSLNVTANTFNSNYDTILQVWQGENLQSLSYVNCSDDEYGFGQQSKVSLSLSPSTTYFFQVLGAYGQMGTLRFSVAEADNSKPGQITSLRAVSGSQNGEVDLTWLAPADNNYDPTSGSVVRYFVRYSSAVSINNSNWPQAFTSTGNVLDLEAFPLYQIPPAVLSPGSLQTLTVRNLNPGSTYWFAVRAQDYAGNLSNASNSPFTPSKTPSAAAGDGLGSAQLRNDGGSILNSVPVSSQATVNIRFTVDSSTGLSGGGRIAVRMPDFWSQPSTSPFSFGSPTNGYVFLSTITPTAQLNSLKLSIDPLDNRNVLIDISTSGKLDPGNIINLAYQNTWTQYNKQTGIQFVVKTRASGTGLLLPIASQPSLDAVAGTPVNVGFTDWSYITLGTGTPTPALRLEPKDNSYQAAVANKDLKIRLFTLRYDTNTYTYQYDSNASLSKNNFATTLDSTTVSTSAFTASQWNTSLGMIAFATYYIFTIPNGSSGEDIYYKTTTIGDTILWIEYNNDFDTGFSTYTTSRWFKVRSQAARFDNLAVIPSTITPDGDGSNEFGVISFTPTVSDSQWRVRIGTDPILSQLSALTVNVGGGGGAAPVAGGIAGSSINVFMDWWGYGAPQGVTWYGNDFMGATLPDSTSGYIVRVEDIGGAAISTTTAYINSAYIDVFVTKPDGSGAANASISANGSSGQGYVYRYKQAGPNGSARIWGLKSGSSYNLQVSFYDSATDKSFNKSVFNVLAGSSQTVSFTQPAEVRVHCTLPGGAQNTYDQWGSVNVVDNNSGFPVGYGSIRFPAGNLESDSGWSSTGFPSSWTVLNVDTGKTYKIRIEMYGFKPIEITTTVTTAGSHDFLKAYELKPKVMGYVIMPSTQQYGTWISIEGTKAGEKFPTAWSGAWIPGVNDGAGIARTTGTFLMDVEQTTYTIKARAFGIGTVSTGPVIISSTGIGTLLSGDFNSGNAVIQNGLSLVFSTVSTGISGVVTVNGDTSQLPSYMIQGGSYTLYLNAFSPTNYSYSYTQVKLATSTSISSAAYSLSGLEDGSYQMYSYLQGFEVFPPGPKIANVVNGTGNLNLTLNQFTGQITTKFDISPNTDFGNVKISINGPSLSNTVSNITTASGYAAAGSTATLPFSQLGTGFYTLEAFYSRTGISRSQRINVVNGQVSVTTFTLTGSTFSVTGTAQVQAFTFGATALSTGTRVDTIADLVAKTGTDSIYVGTTTISMPIARIEAYPRDENNFGDGIANFVNVNAGNYGSSGVYGSQFGFGDVKFGTINSSGVWKIDSLTPGVYILRHPVNLDPSANYYNSTQGSSFETNGADVANEQKIVLITDTGTVKILSPENGDLNFTYTAGAEVSGQIKLPSNVASDTRFLTVLVQNDRKEIVSWQSVYLNGSAVTYRVKNLGNGEYTVMVNDERKGNQTNPDQYIPGQNFAKYVAKPLKIKINGGNLSSQDIELKRSGYFEGKLAIVRISSSGTKSTELITSNNTSLLPDNFRIFAYSESIGRSIVGETAQDCTGTAGQNSSCKISIDSSKGTFLISNIFPDTDYDVFIKQDSFSSDILGKGQLNLVPHEVSGVSVAAGQAHDMGTIEVQMGLTITGQVEGLQTNGSTIPVANLRITAKPSGGNNSRDYELQTFSDSKGSFTLSGLSPDLRYYDITFAARNREDFTTIFTGVESRYAQKIKRNADVRLSTVPVNVVLELGLGAITGNISTSDGGSLKMPFSKGNGGGGSSSDSFPAAVVIANKQGDIPVDNPLGNIEVQTDLSGNFTIDKLAPGTYDLYAISLGYATSKSSITVPATVTSTTVVKNMVLSTGLSLSGDIKKPDGTSPLQSEAGTLVAANADFSELAIASLKTNSITGTVDSYILAGLKAGTTYQLVFFTEDDDTIVPVESASGIWLTENKSNFNLTYAQSKPDAFMKGKKTGTQVSGVDQYRFEFELTQALRNKTLREKEDTYWTDVIKADVGTVSADPTETNPLSPNRKKLIVLYVPPSASTSKVQFTLNGFTDVLEPGTTKSFNINLTFDYFLGLDGQKIGKINMSKGGKISLEGDNTEAAIPAGALQDLNGNNLSVSSSVSVGLQKAQDVATATSSVSGAPALIQKTDESLPPVLARAMQSMRKISQEEKTAKINAAPGIHGAAQNASDVASNVLGAFYDIFLPAGVNRTLKKNATITLSYSSNVANTDDLNVYFYNDTNSTMTATGGQSVPPGAYGLESTSKTVDTANKTITVQTNHFTVYVVVNATSAVLGSGVTITGSGNTATFTKGSVNILNLTAGSTTTVSGIPVSGGADESHSFCVISTGTGGAGIIFNVQSHLQTFSLALNQEQLIDLNDDGLKDVSLKPTGVAGSIVTVNLAGQIGFTLPTTVDYTGTEIEVFNFPNPFNASTRGFLFTGTKTVGQQTLRAEGATAIRYALPSNLGAGTVRVSLEVFDVAGDLVRRVDFGDQTTGKYHYGDWDGKNENGTTVASGVYIGRLAIEGNSRTKTFKMAVVK